MSPSRRRSTGVVRTVKKKIPIVGLEGQAIAESRCVHMLYDIEHVLRYGNQLGEQLTFAFRATLEEPDHTYELLSPRDSVSANRRSWRHVGTTPTGSTKPVDGKATIKAPDGMDVGTCDIHYSVSQRMPKSQTYSRTLTVPLT